MIRLITAIPVWIVLADMVYGLSLNIMQSMNLYQNNTRLPPDGLPVSPVIAFNGLQLAANGGMILIIGFGLLVLLRLNCTVLRGQILEIGVFRALGLLAVLAFSVPSLWQWFWTLIDTAQGLDVINRSNPRYLVAAACIPYVALLCLWRLFGWYRLHKTVAPEMFADDAGRMQM